MHHIKICLFFVILPPDIQIMKMAILIGVI